MRGGVTKLIIEQSQCARKHVVKKWEEATEPPIIYNIKKTTSLFTIELRYRRSSNNILQKLCILIIDRSA